MRSNESKSDRAPLVNLKRTFSFLYFERVNRLLHRSSVLLIDATETTKIYETTPLKSATCALP